MKKPVLVLSLVLASALIPVLVLAEAAVDYTNLTVEWVDNEKIKASVEWNEGIWDGLERLSQLIHIPLSLWWIIPLFLLCSLLYCGGTFRIDDNMGIWVLKTLLPVQLIMLLLSALAVRLLLESPGTLAELSEIPDPWLAENAKEAFSGNYYRLMFWGTFASFFMADVCGFLISAAATLFLDNVIEVIENKALKRVDEGNFIMISPHKSVKLVRFVPRFSWIPFPISAHLQVKQKISFSELSCIFLKNAQEHVLSRLKEGLPPFFHQRMKEMCNGAIQDFTKSMAEGVRSEVLKRVESLEKDPIFKEVEGMLMRLTDKRLCAFRSDILNGASSTLQDSASKVMDGLLKPSPLTRENLVLLPRGTRLFLKKGDESLVVVEQEPQARTMFFSLNFAMKMKGKRQSYLAFPYMIFIIKFYDDRYSQLRVFCSQKRLSSVDDTLYCVNLPNIGVSGEVCFSPRVDRRSTIAEQVECVIRFFWQSIFNTDLRQNFEEMARIDSKHFKTLSRWERCSRKDPRFVLGEDIPWVSHCKLNDVVERFIRENPRHPIIDELEKRLSKSVSGFEEDFRNFLLSFKVSQRYQKRSIKTLADWLILLASKSSPKVNSGVKEFEETLLAAAEMAFSKEVDSIILGDETESDITPSSLFEYIREASK